jgi:Ca2+-binding EF-hand superfamily protein
MSDVEAILTKMRASLARRGAEGIRGLGRHFKICDKNRNGLLDFEEFEQCCRLNKLGLSSSEMSTLLRFFDRDGNGEVSYDEFLRGLRGRLSATRKALVMKVFEILDKIGGERGYLTGECMKHYSVSKHPEVISGKMTKEEALQDFVNSFEGTEGNRDGKVTLDEWIKYYEEMSASIDNDDHFGLLLKQCWHHLKQRMPDGSTAPALKFTPKAGVDLLEKKLKEAIYQKTPPNTNMRRTTELAFKALDTDGSGDVDLNEFIRALERFGMHVSGQRAGVGGLPMESVKALFERYDKDGSGKISYKEFTTELLQEEDRVATQDGGEQKSLTGKTCYKDNEWLKGSNGIFDGIGGSSARGKLRPPTGPGIGGNFNRRIGQMG